LATLDAAYETDGPALVACNEGSNVIYPPGAPGYVYDPTGSVNKDPATAVSCLISIRVQKDVLLAIYLNSRLHPLSFVIVMGGQGIQCTFDVAPLRSWFQEG
jgi:hypothetical protein